MKVRVILRHLVRPRSLRRQMIVAITGVHMILMVSFVFDLVQRQQQFLTDRARARTLHHADVLAASAVPQLITRDRAGLQEILESMRRDPSVRTVTVTDTSGRIMGDSDTHKLGLFLTDQRSLEVLNGQTRQIIVHEGATTIWAASPIRSGTSLLGWAWVGGDLTRDIQQLQDVRQTGMIYIVVAVLSGAAFAVLLANVITRQLRLLLAGTRRLAEDRLQEPVPVVTENDVGVVARAFNTAMERLAAERAQLVQTRNRLEAEVRERRRAEEELKRANRTMTLVNESLKQFTSAVSHDLHEPLRGVTAYSDLLKRRYSGKLDQDANDFIDFIYEGAERMQRLIKGLLDYSRVGSTDSEPTVVDTQAAVRAALKNLATAVEEREAVVHFDKLPQVLAHDVAIAQLFQNLIGNAIKYGKPGQSPVIRISAEQQQRTWQFAVQDNGIGVPPEHHERIFRIFKRAHGNAYQGTGVGLAICSKIVERYGGRIWIESEAGQGSTFRFTLPAAGAQGSNGAALHGLDRAAGCDAA